MHPFLKKSWIRPCNTKLIKNITSKSSPFVKKIACIDGEGLLVSVLGAKMAKKLKQKKWAKFPTKAQKSSKVHFIWEIW